MGSVHVVGSINMDVVAYVDRLPVPGETAFGRQTRLLPGGKGANQAVAASRLGAATKLAGRVGADDFGRQLLSFLAAERVGVSAVGVADEVATGTAIVVVEDGGRNAIIVVPGANGVWHAGYESGWTFAPGDLVVAQNEIPETVIVAAFRAARSAGARTLLNPAPMRALSLELLSLTEIAVLNEIEIGQATGESVSADDLAGVERAARSLCRRGPTSIVVTLGSAGALALDNAELHRIEGLAVPAVDTTGAGDCFVGALAASLAGGKTMPEALDRANRAAAISVTRQGAAVSMPTLAELERSFA